MINKNQESINNRLRNISHIARDTNHLSNNVAGEIFGNRGQIQSALDKNDQISSKVSMSNNFLNGIWRNEAVNK